MARKSGHTSDQTGGGRHGKDNGKGGKGGDARRTTDSGNPAAVTGRRANRRAEHTQTIRVGIFGRETITRGRGVRTGELRDRWGGR